MPAPRRSRAAATASRWLNRAPAPNTSSNPVRAQCLTDLAISPASLPRSASHTCRPTRRLRPLAAPASSAARSRSPSMGPSGQTRQAQRLEQHRRPRERGGGAVDRLPLAPSSPKVELTNTRSRWSGVWMTDSSPQPLVHRSPWWFPTAPVRNGPVPPASPAQPALSAIAAPDQRPGSEHTQRDSSRHPRARFLLALWQGPQAHGSHDGDTALVALQDGVSARRSAKTKR
jgi:hypothetical protein